MPGLTGHLFYYDGVVEMPGRAGHDGDDVNCVFVDDGVSRS